jgi:uncharacterized protein YsxB (DUF464 family)
MVTVQFQLNGRAIQSVEMTGHAGYGPEGQDIVCAAVSSAVMLTHVHICDVLGEDLICQVDESVPRIFLQVPEEHPNKGVQNALSALMLHLVNLKEEYSDFIDVLEV